MDKIHSNTILQFNYYLAGIRGRLRICYLTNSTFESKILKEFTDNSLYCPFLISGVNMKIDSRQWKTAQVDLPKSIKQVILTFYKHLRKILGDFFGR